MGALVAAVEVLMKGAAEKRGAVDCGRPACKSRLVPLSITSVHGK